MKRDVLGWAALAAALVATASAEYDLARAVGFNAWVAAAVPGALDIYTVRAMRARRDVLAAVSAMIGVNAASHLVSAGLLPVNVPLVVAVSAIAPLVLWRVHRLADEHDVPDETEGLDVIRTLPDAPEHAEAEPVPAVPEVYPGAGYTPLPAPSAVFVGPFDKAPKAGPPATEVEPLYPRPELEGIGGSGGGVPAPDTGQGYVPDPVPIAEVQQGYGVPAEPLDELTGKARKEFAELLEDGRTPSIRQLRDTYSIGQPRAQLIQRQLLE